MTSTGTIAEIWRYPVKSMLGERLDAAEVGELGLAGDRAYGVLDVERGTVLSAKREPGLFRCAARYDGGRPVIELPDGTTVADPAEASESLTELIGRRVRLVSAEELPAARLQGEIEPPEGEPSEWDAPPGTFFDASALHLVTIATLRRFRELYPAGDFDPRRFRANFVLDTGEPAGFVEQAWIGESVRIGEIEATVTRPCSRCVMTSHAQSDLARDPGILRTIARENDNNLGVRASVVRGGRVRAGDAVGPAE